jgi:hypothetical protein
MKSSTNPFVTARANAITVHIPTVPSSTDAHAWFRGTGWYFADETKMLNGPYDSRTLAEIASYQYGLFLEGPEDHEEPRPAVSSCSFPQCYISCTDKCPKAVAAVANEAICGDDLIVWPDDEYCRYDELEEFGANKSDDYEVVAWNTVRAAWYTGALEEGCKEVFFHEYWQILGTDNMEKLKDHLGIK